MSRFRMVSATDSKICTVGFAEDNRKIQHNAHGKTCTNSMCADYEINQRLGGAITLQNAKESTNRYSRFYLANLCDHYLLITMHLKS